MDSEKQKPKYRFYKILAWALLGVSLTYLVCGMALTDDHTVTTPLYNVGRVGDIKTTYFRTATEQEGGYQEASGTVVLDQGSFSYNIPLSGYYNEWNYLCVRIDNLSADSLTWRVTYDGIEDETAEEEGATTSVTKTYEVREGMNLLSLPWQEFNRIKIEITGETETSFSVGKMQFRENPPLSNRGRVVGIACLTSFCYVAVTCLLVALRRKSKREHRINFQACMDFLQEGYLLVARRLVLLREKIPALFRRRRVLTTVLFLGMFCYNLYQQVNIDYNTDRYHLLIYVAMILGIAVLSIEEHPTKKNWNNPLVWSWLVLGILACVSDFVVRKNQVGFRYTGYILILVVGFFIFLWNNRKDCGELLEDFARAVHIFLWVIVGYCVLFRSESAGVRYTGPVANPNVFATAWLVLFWAIVLGSIEHVLRTHRKKKALLLYLIELCVVFTLTWESQSVTALTAIAVVGIVWLARMAVYAYRNKGKKALLLTLLCALVLYLPVYEGLTLSLTHVPLALGTEIAYEDDEEIERLSFGEEAYAGEFGGAFSNNRVIRKLTGGSIDTLLAGRNYIYKEYLRDVSLLGNTGRPLVTAIGRYRYAHNNVLAALNYYGIFALAPEIVLLVAAIGLTWKFSRRKVRFAAVPLYVSIAFTVAAMTECLEKPFDRLLWIAMYLLMGCAFCDEDPEEEKALLTEETETLLEETNKIDACVKE